MLPFAAWRHHRGLPSSRRRLWHRTGGRARPRRAWLHRRRLRRARGLEEPCGGPARTLRLCWRCRAMSPTGLPSRRCRHRSRALRPARSALQQRRDGQQARVSRGRHSGAVAVGPRREPDGRVPLHPRGHADDEAQTPRGDRIVNNGSIAARRLRLHHPHGPRVLRNAPVRFASRTDRHCSRVTSSTDAGLLAVPALLKSRLSRPQRSRTVSNRAVTEIRVGDIARHRQHGRGVRAGPPHGLLERLGAPSRDDDSVAMRDEAERDRPSDARAAARDDGNPRWCLHAANGNMTGCEDSPATCLSWLPGRRQSSPAPAWPARCGGHARHRCRFGRGVRSTTGGSIRASAPSRTSRSCAPSSSATSTSSITWRPCSAGSPRRSSTSACASTSMARAGCSRPVACRRARRGSCSRARSPRLAGRCPRSSPRRRWSSPSRATARRRRFASCWCRRTPRRGFVDGISCRVPTVAIRPGKPNSALSSFVSGIPREPLAGVDAVCPVPLETPVWISSPDAATRNLVHAGRVSAASLGGRRTVNLPGLSVTPGEMLDSLERLAGHAVRARVRVEVDPRTARIVGTGRARSTSRGR